MARHSTILLASLQASLAQTQRAFRFDRSYLLSNRIESFANRPEPEMTPIQLYTYQTPNGHKASIMLEETGLPYDVHIVDIENGAQHSPEFLALNPNNKIPVIVDPDRHRTVVESGAILLYLAERSGVLKPRDETEAGLTLQWILFQAAHVGPTLGQLWNYKIFAPEKIPM